MGGFEPTMDDQQVQQTIIQLTDGLPAKWHQKKLSNRLVFYCKRGWVYAQVEERQDGQFYGHVSTPGAVIYETEEGHDRPFDAAEELRQPFEMMVETKERLEALQEDG